jgi:pyridoxine 4-dehydrogenase
VIASSRAGEASLTAIPAGTAGALDGVLEPIAARHGATIPQVALAWLLARSPAVLPVPATTEITHLRENLDAQELELTPDELETINGLAPEHGPA